MANKKRKESTQFVLTAETALGPVLSQMFHDITDALVVVTNNAMTPQEMVLVSPPTPTMGDMAFRCFELAQRTGEDAASLAQQIASKLDSTEYVERWEAHGPYVNCFLRRGMVAEQCIRAIQEQNEQYGMGLTAPNETVMVEYVSPNTNKPLHLGHVRNGLLGWSIAELLRAQGSTVVKTDIINDRGVHIMKSLYAYATWGNGATPESTGRKSDHFLGDMYVRFEQELAQERKQWYSQHGVDSAHMTEQEKKKTEEQFLADSQLMEQVRTLLKQWEAGDAEVRSLWKTMNDWAYEGFATTYAKLGLDFDKHYYESDISESGKALVEKGIAKGIFLRRDDGSVVAPLSGITSLPDKVLLRSDGTTLYVTQDVFLAQKKAQDFGLTRSIYVVGSEQNLYFEQLFAVLRLLGYPWADHLEHLSYGMVNLPEGKMKSREGTVVDADDLLASLEELALQELAQRYPKLDAQQRQERASVIALGALKFHFLAVTKDTPITFDPKASLSFEGRTGPYVQYTYARASSILRKAGQDDAADQPTQLNDAEWELMLQLVMYPIIVLQAGTDLDPGKLANYLADLAQQFSSFYHDMPVLKAGKAERALRLQLVRGVRTVLKNGLQMLGIRTLEEM